MKLKTPSTLVLRRATLTACAVAALLAACGGGSPGTSETAMAALSAGTPRSLNRIAGVAAAPGAPLAGAQVRVCDANGQMRAGHTGKDGAFEVLVEGLQPPLLVSARSAPFIEINGVPQPANGTQAYAALLPTLAAGGTSVANVNPLTDKIASDVAATDLKLKGSVQLMNACNTAGVSAATVAGKTAALRTLVADALTLKGVPDVASFDPVTRPMRADGSGVDAVLKSLLHNRDGWGSGGDDQLRGTKLYDLNVQELSPGNVRLDASLPPWSAAKTRIFVVGDSTSSNYGADVAPRMGWGQALPRHLKPEADARVVNLAQSGRSSRSFITEGWFRILSEHLQAGDYVLIQWGHNDEKCDVTGSLDWVNRCTYPNSAAGAPQAARTVAGLPEGTSAEDLSFQRSLEKYVALARARGATPVLITPVTRINRDAAVSGYVEGKFPIAASTHVTTKGDFPGHYTQTVLDTAAAHGVPAVDLDARSIAFFNAIGVGSGGADASGGWRDHYLAVSDPLRHPFYASAAVVGHVLNADRTHFQERGAVTVASLVVEGLKADPARLAGLIALLK